MILNIPDEFKYPCTMCSQKFKWLTSLQTHMQIHTQNKAVVQCNECFKRFFNHRTLERHIKIHQSLKFQCKICSQISSNRKDNIMRHIRHLHTDIPKNEIFKHISTIEGDKKKIDEEVVRKEQPVTESKNTEEITLDDDGDSNDLIIDESVPQEEREEEKVTEVPVINNRVNVIQSIGNPNKNQQSQVQPMILDKTSVKQPDKAKEQEEIVLKSVTTQPEQQQQQQQLTCDNNIIQLPPKKKAIAKYNPIEHYRKILGLPDTTDSLEANECEQSEVFPDHWRKRTSQNFLFRR